MPKIKQTTRIAREIARLENILDGADANQIAVAKTLIERAAYLTISLEDLEREITKSGWTEEYRNGENQKGVKKSAAADAHISLTKNLTAITKQLLEIAPAAKKGSKLEALRREMGSGTYD